MYTSCHVTEMATIEREDISLGLVYSQDGGNHVGDRIEISRNQVTAATIARIFTVSCNSCNVATSAQCRWLTVTDSMII